MGVCVCGGVVLKQSLPVQSLCLVPCYPSGSAHEQYLNHCVSLPIRDCVKYTAGDVLHIVQFCRYDVCHNSQTVKCYCRKRDVAVVKLIGAHSVAMRIVMLVMSVITQQPTLNSVASVTEVMHSSKEFNVTAAVTSTGLRVKHHAQVVLKI